MDPITHTLTGVAIGRTGIARATPLAMAALIVGANIPDIDIMASFAGADASLNWRRGWSHGPVGLLVLPLVLVGGLWLWRRITARPGDVPVRYGRLTVLAYLAALTHPALDWLNTYGIRFLMPFSESWFYGDAVFIADPWLWLLLAGPAVLASSRGRLGQGLWTLLAVMLTMPLILIPFVSRVALVVWLAGVLALVLLRWRGQGIDQRRYATLVCVGVLGFVALMLWGTSVARRRVAERDGVLLASVVMAGPVPANPFRREVITARDGSYAVREVGWLPGAGMSAATVWPIGDGPAARAAAAAPGIAGYMAWVRFPTFRLTPSDIGTRVDIVDVRYGQLAGGFGSATVWLDRELRPLRAEVH